MSKLIVYLVDYVDMKHNVYRNYISDGKNKLTKTARIKMLPEELQKTLGYSSNHYRVEKKFFKIYENKEDTTYSGDKYRVTRVRKA